MKRQMADGSYADMGPRRVPMLHAGSNFGVSKRRARSTYIRGAVAIAERPFSEAMKEWGSGLAEGCTCPVCRDRRQRGIVATDPHPPHRPSRKSRLTREAEEARWQAARAAHAERRAREEAERQAFDAWVQTDPGLAEQQRDLDATLARMREADSDAERFVLAAEYDERWGLAA